MRNVSPSCNVLIAADLYTERWLKSFAENQRQYCYVRDFATAQRLVRTRKFDAIIVSIYFDGYQAFNVLKAARESTLNSASRFTCLRSRRTSISPTCDPVTKVALRALGADYFWNVSEPDSDCSFETHDFPEIAEVLKQVISGEFDVSFADTSKSQVERLAHPSFQGTAIAGE